MKNGSRQKLRKKDFLGSNENEFTTCSDLRDAVKLVLRGRFIALSPSTSKQQQQTREILHLTTHLKALDQRFSASLMLGPFNTVPHVVVTPSHQTIFFAAS